MKSQIVMFSKCFTKISKCYRWARNGFPSHRNFQHIKTSLCIESGQKSKQNLGRKLV